MLLSAIVPSRFYDVAVLGTELAPLTCAALLAKRGFRVLVVGQGTDRADYAVGGLRLPRRPFVLPSAHAPVASRIVNELGLSQSFRRAAQRLEPALQIALPDHRIDFFGDDARLDQEIERELPEVKRPVLDVHRRMLALARSTDALFERIRVWPPRTLLERRALAQLSDKLDLDETRRTSHTLGELADSHPFRQAVHALCMFATDCDPSELSELLLARLWRGRLADAVALAGGRAELLDLLGERLRRHSGEILPREHAAHIVVRRGAAVGLHLAESGEEIGCSTVVAGVDVASLQRLLEDRSPFEELFERLGEPQAKAYRYTLNLVTDARMVPPGMQRDVLYLRRGPRDARAGQPLHVEQRELPDGRRLLCVETTLPAHTVEKRDGSLGGVRERVLAGVSELAPFIDQQLLLIDSPHDGLKPKLPTAELDARLDPLESRGPHTMVPIYDFPVTTALSFCAMPVRMPVRGLLLCNPQVAPGLGVEGELLAAGSAALEAQHGDRGREWLRRRLWTKVEL